MSRTARFKACVRLSGGLPRPCSLFHIDAVPTDMLSQARMEARAPSWCCVQQLHVAMQPAFFAPGGYAIVPVWGKKPSERIDARQRPTGKLRAAREAGFGPRP